MDNGKKPPNGGTEPTSPGLLIRLRLEKLGMTEQELAEASGERLETVNRIICIRCRLTAPKAEALAGPLGLRAEVLMDAQRDVDLWHVRTREAPPPGTPPAKPRRVGEASGGDAEPRAPS
jgi:addiction module HigA family antidote